MKEYKYRFISSKFLFCLCIVDILLFTVAFISITFYALWSGFFTLLMGDIITLIALIIGFILLHKEVYFVKVYDEKITFKALCQKEKVLAISEIKNIYEYGILRTGNYYFLGTRDVSINKARITDTELPEREILKFGYPFKISVNAQTTKIIREVWGKSMIQVTIK